MYRCIHLGMMQSATGEKSKVMESDERTIVLCSAMPIIPLLLLVLSQLKNIYRSQLFIGASFGGTCRSKPTSKMVFPLKWTTHQSMEKRRPTPVSFSSLKAAGAGYMRRRKTGERKKKIDAHRWPRYIFFMLWNHLQLEYTCTAARHKMESRAGRDLTGVGTNLKLQRDLLFAAKRIDADVRFWLL